jgi:hypothetical protein
MSSIHVITLIFRLISTQFSAKAPPMDLEYARLPHITIQVPVYKEGLDNVIAPTINSLKAAVKNYQLHGGSANIFVNDDG